LSHQPYSEQTSFCIAPRDTSATDGLPQPASTTALNGLHCACEFCTHRHTLLQELSAAIRLKRAILGKCLIIECHGGGSRLHFALAGIFRARNLRELLRQPEHAKQLGIFTRRRVRGCEQLFAEKDRIGARQEAENL